MNNEIWKPVPGYEKFYKVSNLGRVKALSFIDKKGQMVADRILSPCEANGYLTIVLSKRDEKPIYGKRVVNKNFRVHRLVAMAFIPNPEHKPEVNHKDGNKSNNHVDNLEWVSREENLKHSIKMQRSYWGI